MECAGLPALWFVFLCLGESGSKLPHSICFAIFSAAMNGGRWMQNRFSGLVEFSKVFHPRRGISHVLFDFDGTLSLIRQGWPEVMVPMFVEMLPAKSGE